MKLKRPFKPLGALGMAAAAGLIGALAFGSAAQAEETSTAYLKDAHKNLTAVEGDWDIACGEENQIPADKPDDADGWVFILPASTGEAFVSVTATFDDGEGNLTDIDATIVATANGTQFKHAYVETPAGWTLVDAVAEITGAGKDTDFNVTHTCPGEDVPDEETPTTPGESETPSEDVTSPGGEESPTVPGEASTTPTGTLPTTGAPLTIALVSAAALAAGGAVLFFLMRRRQAAQDW